MSDRRISDDTGAELLKSVVGRFRAARVAVYGGSMLPAIRPGDVLAIEAVDLVSVSTDDVVLFAWQGRILAHRVVSPSTGSQPCLQTRGDRHGHDDPPVDRASLIGRVTQVERAGRVVAEGTWRRPGKIEWFRLLETYARQALARARRA